MRTLLVVLLITAAFAGLPTASAGAFDLGTEKTIEQGLALGEDATFEMPLTINQDGLIYAKILVTPRNAVNDGTKVNGSVELGTGWRVTFAMRDSEGTVTPLGTYVDSTVSPRVLVKNGEEHTLIATVHIPSDADKGGPRQRVYIAIGYRLEEDSQTGTNSGASIEEARAVTLLMTNDLLPPVVQRPPVAEEPDEVEGVEPLPEGGGRTQVVVQNGLPFWFMISIVLILGVGVVAVAGLAVVFGRIHVDLRTANERALRRESDHEIPVEAAREFLSTLSKAGSRRIEVQTADEGETESPLVERE